jgi:hypothetical protein
MTKSETRIKFEIRNPKGENAALIGGFHWGGPWPVRAVYFPIGDRRFR